MDARVSDLQEKVAVFVRERDWEQFHTPKDVAMSIAIEAAELLELFQWKSPEDIRSLMNEKMFLKKIAGEIADVMIYLLVLSQGLKIDVSQAVMDKIEMNKKRYPVEKSKGTAKKYSDL